MAGRRRTGFGVVVMEEAGADRTITGKRLGTLASVRVAFPHGL
jgi:hypothetical protein